MVPVHNICTECWRAQAGGRPAVHIADPPAEWCCFCGGPTNAGVYVAQPDTPASCRGHDDELPPAAHCRDCGARLDDATAADFGDDTPEAGAVSVCFYCACISIFTGDGLELREPTAAELAACALDADIRRVVAAVRHFNRRASR